MQNYKKFDFVILIPVFQDDDKIGPLKNQLDQYLSNKEYFSDLFIPLSIITCLVITVIKFSLALSLGLVGALSIVRFRAAIKEPEELIYLFLIPAAIYNFRNKLRTANQIEIEDENQDIL